MGVVLCSGLVRSSHEEVRTLPQQLLGLLLGCHLREHRWQKFKMMFVSRRWQQLNRGLWSSPAEVIATVSGLIAIVGAVVAIVRWIAVATSVA